MTQPHWDDGQFSYQASAYPWKYSPMQSLSHCEHIDLTGASAVDPCKVADQRKKIIYWHQYVCSQHDHVVGQQTWELQYFHTVYTWTTQNRRIIDLRAPLSTRGVPSASIGFVPKGLCESMPPVARSRLDPELTPRLEDSPLRFLGYIPKRVWLRYLCANLSRSMLASATRAGVRLAKIASDDVRRT